MPKAKRIRRKTAKRRTRRVRKPRSKLSRKYYRKRYRRLRRYHRRVRRRKTKSIYRIKNTIGYKFSSTWNLSDFLLLGYTQNHWVFNCPFLSYNMMGAGSDHGKTPAWRFNYLNDTFANAARTMTRKWFGVISSDYFTHPLFGGTDEQRHNIGFRAYNPFLRNTIAGPLFESYCTQYRKFKFVGLKVKWIPNTSIHPSYNAGIAAYTSGSVEGVDPTNITSWASVLSKADRVTIGQNGEVSAINVSAPIKDRNSSNIYTQQRVSTFYDSLNAAQIIPGLGINTNWFENAQTSLPYYWQPNKLRLWINFSKQGYASEPLCEKVVENSTASALINIRNCTFKFGEIFNRNNNQTIDHRMIRSYSFNKPFKFFVRPKVARRFYERPEEETTGQLTTGQASAPQNSILVENADKANMYKSARMPYVYIPRFEPNNELYRFGCDYYYDTTNTRALRSLMDDCYFNPILFGWAITCDNLPSNQQVDLFHLYKLAGDKGAEEEEKYWEYFRVMVPPQINNMGRFKITCYTRFKCPRQHQLLAVIDREDAIASVNEPVEGSDDDQGEDPN